MTTLVPRAGAPAPWRFAMPGLGGACRWLQSLGCEPGTRLGLTAANHSMLPALYQAAAVLGADLIVAHHRAPVAQRQAQLAAAQCGIILGDCPGAQPLPGFWTEAEAPLARGGGALVMHSSGSMGEPRRVRLPWDRVHAACQAAVHHVGMGPEETWLAALPMDHIGGAALIFRAAVAGTPLHLCGFETDTVRQAASAGRIHAASLVPTVLYRLQMGGWRFPGTVRWIVGGAPLSRQVAEHALRAGCQLWTTYGMTESTAMLACGRQTDPTRLSAGALIPGWELRIDGPNEDGFGVIQVRGPGRCAGYEPEACSQPSPVDAWFSTGDIGRQTGNEVEVLGRKDAVIVSGGEKVAPEWVEQILAQHPAVRDVAVGASPDPEWGQVVTAWIVIDGEVAVSDLDTWCRQHLGPHQRPRRWIRVAALPRSALGKLRRQELLAGGAGSPVGDKPIASSGVSDENRAHPRSGQ